MTEITKVYLDHNATTPVSDLVLTALPEALKAWGNPSSIHWAGRSAKLLIREARKNLSEALNINPLEIIFTSGASESNSTILQSCFELSKNSRPEFITSTVEHPSVMKTMKSLEAKGAVVHYVPVNRAGQIDLEFYRAVLSEKTALVSIMYANNETGVIFPISKMAELAHAQGALFHSDCVQAFGKIPLDLAGLGVEFASLSGHKVYALKGTGIIYSRKGSNLLPLIHGGGQERHRRGGTENTLGIFSMGIMAKAISDSIDEVTLKMSELRKHLEQRILSEISSVEITSAGALRVPNTSSLVIQGIDGETLLMSLDLKGFAVSTGAACSSGSPEPSPVLLAIGLSREEAQSSLRISIGWETTALQINEFVDTLKLVVERLRSLNTQEQQTYA
jgi:cysteine desulfurase